MLNTDIAKEENRLNYLGLNVSLWEMTNDHTFASFSGSIDHGKA